MIVKLEIMCLAFFHVVAIITNLSTLRVQRYTFFFKYNFFLPNTQIPTGTAPHFHLKALTNPHRTNNQRLQFKGKTISKIAESSPPQGKSP